MSVYELISIYLVGGLEYEMLCNKNHLTNYEPSYEVSDQKQRA